MSNTLFVRRVKFQEIDEEGNPIGDPDYGVLASDDYETDFNNGYRTLEDLNEAVRTLGCLLDLVNGFEDVDRSQVGFKNYVGNPGTASDTEIEDEQLPERT